MQLAGHKVKVMLAEPKTKRGRQDGSPDMMVRSEGPHACFMALRLWRSAGAAVTAQLGWL